MTHKNLQPIFESTADPTVARLRWMAKQQYRTRGCKCNRRKREDIDCPVREHSRAARSQQKLMF